MASASRRSRVPGRQCMMRRGIMMMPERRQPRRQAAAAAADLICLKDPRALLLWDLLAGFVVHFVRRRDLTLRVTKAAFVVVTA